MKVPNALVPRTRPSSQPLAYLSDAGATPEAFGAGIGRGLAAVGGAVESYQAKLQARDEQTDRFSSLTNFSEFDTRVSTRLAEMKRDADPSGKGFTKSAAAEYDRMQADFLKNDVTPELQEEFRYRASQIKQRVIGESVDFQYKAGDSFYKVGIDNIYQGALKGLDPSTGGDPTQLEAYKSQVFEAIDVSDLAEIDKVTLKRNTAIGLESIAYKETYKVTKAVSVGNLPDTVGGVVDAAADRYGVPKSAMRTTAWLESRGNPGAKNPNSSAGGLFQFIDSTARGYGLKNKYDEAESADAAARLMRDNMNGLRKTLGRDPSDGELYLAHQQGLGGAQKLLGNPNALAVDVVGYQAVKLNGGAPGMTARQFANLWIKKAGDATPNLDSNPAFANVPYETRLAMQKDADTELNQQAAAEAKERKYIVDVQQNALLNNIMDGTAGQEAIDKGVEEGWLGDFDARKKAQDLYDKKVEDVNIVAAFANKLNTPNPVFDPTDSKHQEGFNKWVGKDGLAKLAGKDEDYFNNTLLPAVQKSHDMPTDVAGLFMGMARSNDVAKSLYAYDALRRLQDADPRAYNQRVTGDMAKDVEIYAARKDLYDDGKLYETLNPPPEQRQQVEELRKEGQSLLLDKTGGTSELSTLVADVVGDYSSSIPFTADTKLAAVPAFAMELERDYQTLFVDAYAKTRDKDKADEIARTLLKRDWGVSNVTGNPVLMKHPPELVGYKELGGDYSWIDKQIRKELNIDPLSGESFELLSDDQTKKEYEAWQRGEGPPASYKVMTIGADGYTVSMPLDENGRPVRRYFVPEPEDIQRDVTVFESKMMTEELTDAYNKLQRAVDFYGAQGMPVPDEFQQNIDALEQRYQALQPEQYDEFTKKFLRGVSPAGVVSPAIMPLSGN